MEDAEGFFVYLMQGLYFRFFIYAIFFAIDQAIWSTLYHFGVLEHAHSYVDALQVYSYVLTAVYYLWFTTFLTGYSSPASEYRRLLNHTNYFCQKFYSCAIKSSMITIMKRDRGSAKMKAQIEEEMVFHDSCHRCIREMPDLMRGVVYHSLELFTSKTLPSLEMRNLEKNIIYELIDKKNAKEKIDFLMFQIGLRIKELEILDYLEDADTISINKNIDCINDSLITIDIGNNVREPNIYKQYIRVVIFAYFLLWIPFLLAINTGWVAILIYPIIMCLTVGPAVIRGWLGDCFDPMRPLHINRHEEWRLEFMNHITNYEIQFNNQSRALLHGEPLLPIHSHNKKRYLGTNPVGKIPVIGQESWDIQNSIPFTSNPTL